MFIVTFDSAAVKPTPAAVAAAARPFGLGILRRPTGPTATDLAFEAGRSIGLEAGRPVAPPACYSAAERAAFLDGLDAASAIIDDREADHLAEMELQADADDRMSAGLAWY